MKEGTAVDPHRPVRAQPHAGASVPLDTIGAAGAYVCDWSGYLLRVPDYGVRVGLPVGLNIVGREPLTVTKISDDPEVPLTEARRLAASLGLRTGF